MKAFVLSSFFSHKHSPNKFSSVFCLSERVVSVILLCAVSLLSACKREEEDITWDFVCYMVDFYVSEARTGANLLDAATEGNILNNDIYVEYNGNRYDMYKNSPGLYGYAETRYIMPAPLGLRLRPYDFQWNFVSKSWERRGSWHLEFGEFSPANGYRGSEFTIYWGDGTSNTVRFDCYVEWKSRNNPVVYRQLWLDGASQKKNWTCTIIR